MKVHARLRIVLPAVLGLEALLVSCSAGILEDIRKDVEQSRLSAKPVINVFQLTSPNPTGNRTVSIQLSGSAIAAAWFVGEDATAPAAGSPGWVSPAPTQYILSAGDGVKAVRAWARTSGGELSDPRSFTVTLDQTPPVLTTFTLTSGSPTSSPNITFTLAGTDANGITQWLVNESATPPGLADSGWIAATPSGFTVSAGSGAKTVHAWARDQAGNISASMSFSLTYNDPGNTPVVLSFTRTSASPTNALLVTFTLTGNVDAKYWIVREGATPPAPADAGWQASAPGDFTLTGSDGTRTLYAWARNDYSVVSSSVSLSLILDRAKPSVDAPVRTSPADSDSRDVTFNPLSGSDANGITAWFQKESSPPPSLGDSGWVSSAPSQYTVTSAAGPHTIYVWARDAAGNMSDPAATISMTLWPTPAATLQGAADRVGHETIQLRFNASMNTASVSVTGDMSACTKGWSTSTLTNDTLTLTPTTLWPTGAGRTLGVTGSSSVGIAMTSFNAAFTVSYRIYVNDTNGGNDGNPGTPSLPRASLQSAIALATARYVPTNAVDILVAQGTYAVDFNLSAQPVAVMAEKASVYGGYADGDYTLRNPTTYSTILRDLSTAGGASPNAANRAVYFGTGITSQTVLDGCQLEAATGGTICTAVLCESSSPVIRNCTIAGRTGSSAMYSIGSLNIASASPEITGCTADGGTGTYSTGIYNIGSSPSIHDNTSILGGQGTSQSRGIYNEGSSPLITGNTIRAGSAAVNTRAIYNYAGSSAKIYNNIISGGTGGNGGTGTSYGIYNDSSSPDIRNNTIDGGQDANTASPYPCGIWNQLTSHPVIENNIIFIRFDIYGWGIYEKAAADNPASLKNNDIFDCGNGLYVNDGISASPLTTISAVEALDPANFTANTKTSGVFVNQAGLDWHLNSNPSTLTAVAQGGRDLSAVTDFPHAAGGAKIDITGALRTLPWSMGVYEKD